MKSGRLSLPFEEQEKQLLAIGEALGLRGDAVDALHTEAVAAGRLKTVKSALDDVKQMTLTVVDGDFPREVLARQNLTFAEYRMPASRNRAEIYDARTKQPARKKPGVMERRRTLPVSSALSPAT